LSNRLLALATVALAGAGALAIIAGIRAGQGDGVVLQVESARAAVLPSTVPPLSSAPVVESSNPSERDSAGRADTGSSAPGQRVHELDRPTPVGLQIDTIDVSHYPVRDVGLEDDGQLELPDETEIGWYKYGATAGHPGATVLAAHVNWKGAEGPFARLGTVDPGDQIEVSLDDGSTRSYEVTERAMYGKSELPNGRLWRNTGPEELVLITCGGDFNPDLRSYRSNIVIYAVPVS
jgi:hypothetical protein